MSTRGTHEQKLELPDHYPVTEEVRGTILRRFISRLKKIGRAPEYDFIVIDTPGGVQHLSLIAHGMADTLITPINDGFVDLDVLVAMGQNDVEPPPSTYAQTVCHALEARRKVTGRVTNWIIVRNRMESVESSNQRRITRGPSARLSRPRSEGIHGGSFCASEP